MMYFAMTLFLCGDVMTGRGIDQLLPVSVDPVLYERSVRHAEDYVLLAERENGPIPTPVDPAYVWGDALAVLDRENPTARIVNLETSVTTSETPWPGKGINYRMHPGNIPILTTAKVDCCVLANNHTLDWKEKGLRETLQTLRDADIRTVGAGSDLGEAQRPAILEASLSKERVIIFSLASQDSGVPSSWAATERRAGIQVLGPGWFENFVGRVHNLKRPGDVVVVSVHWGSNWGYRIPEWQTELAHRLIDEAEVDIVHGHSSHHVRPLEVYRGKLVLYGCGDFINDYEGIRGHEEFRSDLRLMYFVTFDTSTKRLMRLRVVPMQTRRLRLVHASVEDGQWLTDLMNRICDPSEVTFAFQRDGSLILSGLSE